METREQESGSSAAGDHLAEARRMLDGLDKESTEKLVANLLKQVGGSPGAVSVRGQGQRPRAAGRVFDYSVHPRRHVALKLAYLGGNYHGLASQGPGGVNSVEDELFRALEKVRLLEQRDSSYTRCGRTDKGVSAFCQVIGLVLRCKNTRGLGVLPPLAPGAAGAAQEGGDDLEDEIDYAAMINRVLPEDIRVVGWAPVAPSFNARFDALWRTYKYFFARGGLDVAAMRAASQKLLGSHDFRNLCKIDTVHVHSFERVVLAIDVKPSDCFVGGATHATEVWELEVTGYAFLWHQVRCMMAVLLMIGRGEEKATVIDDLLDIERFPGSPNYPLAPAENLVLYNCAFEGLRFRHSYALQGPLHDHASSLFATAAARAALTARLLADINLALVERPPGHQGSPGDDLVPYGQVTRSALPGYRPPAHHIPLADRKLRPTVADKVNNLGGRKKALHAMIKDRKRKRSPGTGQGIKDGDDDGEGE